MRSHNVTKGLERAPHRSLFWASGYHPAELERPLVGIVNSANEIVPGHVHLAKIAEAVKAGCGWRAARWSLHHCRVRRYRHEPQGNALLLASRKSSPTALRPWSRRTVSTPWFWFLTATNHPGHVDGRCPPDLPAVLVSGGPMLAGEYRGKNESQFPF